jgi:PAS domain S-box-containing protein
MQRRNRLAWKLSVVVLVIVSVVILGTGFLGNLLSRHFALNAARNVMKFNSTSVRSGVDQLMMTRDSTGVAAFIQEMFSENEAFEEMYLVSHPSGRIVASRQQTPGTRLARNDKSCIVCHVNDDLPTPTLEALDEVVAGPNGNKLLQITTPILNRPGCHSAGCHQEAKPGSVLGFVRTEYSLAGFDDLMRSLNVLLALAALLATLLATGALLVMFRRYLAIPLRRLVAGIGTLAAGDLGFRFPGQSDDEIGLVEESFNTMATRIQTQQTELRNALEYQQGIVENTADLIITVNTEGLIQTFNRGAEMALGYSRGEVIDRRVEMLFADPKERDTAIARLREQDPATKWETRFRTKNGQICNVYMTLSRLRDRDGNLIGTLGISKDVTVEKELLRKLFHSEQAAAIGRAVTAIQHAVKNMLNTLKGGLYVVRLGQKNDQPEQISSGCEMIDEGLSRITDLSTNMLKYAREWEIEPEPIDLTRMAEAIVTAVRQTASERSVSIRTEINGSLPKIQCDPRLIHMGLMDIVSNALDACEAKEYDKREKSEIVIRVSRSPNGKSVVLEVQDNGIGMTPEVRNNVFTPFFSTKDTMGTGLGLALTSRVIELHDGHITVESKPAKGAVFRITLPIDSPREKQEEADEQNSHDRRR